MDEDTAQPALTWHVVHVVHVAYVTGVSGARKPLGRVGDRDGTIAWQICP